MALQKMKSELLLLKSGHSLFSFHRSCFVSRPSHASLIQLLLVRSP